jgi:hypothetical protein
VTGLVCAGRPVRRFDNRAAGEPCGTAYDGSIESARVAGWRVGPATPDGGRPAMCPDCARPGDGAETTRPADLVPLPGL